MQAMEEETEEALQVCSTHLGQSIKALRQSRKRDFYELRQFKKAPQKAILCGQAILTLMGIARGEKAQWPIILKEYSKSNFIENLASQIESQKDSFPAQRMLKVANFTKNPDFTKANMRTVSAVCEVFAGLVIAAESYHQASVSTQHVREKLSQLYEQKKKVEQLARLDKQ